MTRSGPQMQLKRYTYDPAKKADFLEVWREIARLRPRCEFTIPFALIDEANAILNWAVGHSDFSSA